jgi:hypothetical protein
MVLVIGVWRLDSRYDGRVLSPGQILEEHKFYDAIGIVY